MTDITTAATTTIAAYAAAVAKGADPSTPRSELVSSMTKFYLPGWTSFTLGSIVHIPNDEATRAAIEGEFSRFDAMGLGSDVRLEDSRVERVSDHSAICFLTWTLHPKEEAPWKFTVVYGFRVAAGRPDGLVGGWEWVNADDEYRQLLARNPKLYG